MRRFSLPTRGDATFFRQVAESGRNPMTEPKHGTSPLIIDETTGKKAYCQCGLSANLPYCDGSHSREGTDVGPIVLEVDTAGKKAVCQCHRSGSLPWCDGTHAKL